MVLMMYIQVNEQTCKICNNIKLLDLFHKDRSRSNGHAKICKVCAINKSKQHYINNRECELAYQKQYTKDHRLQVNELSKQWARNNPDKRKSTTKRWRDNHKEEIHAKRQEKRKNDLTYKIKDALSTRVRLACKAQGAAKSQSITNLIGCTPQELKRHLESKFTDGMNWDNHGKWHIDHIRPLSSFNLIDIEQQLLAFHWSNMQPLWAIDNFLKSNFYTE